MDHQQKYNLAHEKHLIPLTQTNKAIHQNNESIRTTSKEEGQTNCC